ncbi:MAG: sugar transferase [Brevefilum sp.]|nr:sugar transferase [Brevefilum sp.]
MTQKHTIPYPAILIFLDGILVTASLWIATGITSHPVTLNPLLAVPFALVWLVTLAQLGSYNPVKNLRVVDEVYNLLAGALIALILIAGILYLAGGPLTRSAFAYFAVITLALQLVSRLVSRLVFQKGFRQRSQQRILIAGAGKVGRRFAAEINDFSQVGYTLVGFIDDDPELIRHQLDVLGSVDQAAELIKAHQIDNLIIALPQWAYERVNALLEAVHTLPVRTWVIPDYFALMLSKASVWNFVGVPMITLRSPALTHSQRLAKRIFDLALTTPLFVLTLPLYGLAALLVRLDSPGPVLYRSTRVMQNGKTFHMLKFRTMVDQAHERLAEVMTVDANGNTHYKTPDDPRVTKVGRFLRRTSLDELPQLINILRGEMSLVGPRPELPELVGHYQPWQHMRFAVPQGLTGWWQVNGRSDKPMHLHTDEDLYYIQHYSLWLDLQILIKTVLVILRGKGAY